MSHSLGLAPTVPIVQLGDPVLRTECSEWTGSPHGAELADLVELMVDTMHRAPGVGLAAPQIGIPLRLAVLEDLWPADEDTAAARERRPLELIVALNPSYTPLGERTATHYEGCLSMRGYTAAVERPADIRAEWTTPDGERMSADLHGWQARIFQHETDHLSGTLYIDRAMTRSLSTDQNYAVHWADPSPDAARAALGF